MNSNKKTNTMASSQGMSLVEIVVALALLAVIMFFMASTQMNALKMNHKTGIIRELTHTAEREIENRRQEPQLATVVESTSPDCLIEVEEGYTCSTTIHPCSIAPDATGQNTVVCVNTINGVAFSEAEAVSHQVVIDIESPVEGQNQFRRSIRLQTIVEADKGE